MIRRPPRPPLFPYTPLSRSLTAGAAGVGGGTSAAFSVTAGAPSVLVFSVQPASATAGAAITPAVQVTAQDAQGKDRKSTRLNSSHLVISYAVFCLKKKKRRE